MEITATWSNHSSCTEHGMSSTSAYIRGTYGMGHTHQQTENRPFGHTVYSASEQLHTTRTGSFVNINREVVEQIGNITYSETISEYAGPRYVRRPGGDPIGQITPIGDILIPMLVFAAGYVLIRSKRISKILHYAKRK